MQKNRLSRAFAPIAAALALLSAAGFVFGICAVKGVWGKTPKWASALLFGIAALSLLELLFLIALSPSAARDGEPPLWKKLCFSDLMLKKSRSHAVAYAGVMAALCIVSNMLELKFATTQYSVTTLCSVIAGIVLGPVLGFAAVFLGDGVGYLVNSMGYLYYWWVALSVAATAAVAGLCMRLPFRFRGALYAKLAIICVLTLFVCSVGINSTGMYFIGLKLYMPSDVLAAAGERFGGKLTFWIYLVIRYFILGQIWVSVVNYALLFALAPALKAAKLVGGAQPVPEGKRS